MTKNQNHERPKTPESYWIDTKDVPTYPELTENINVDIGIVGGGITGVTTAYLLAKEGYKVALIEADRVLQGTTGHTTAKVTAQHDLIYDELIHHFGKNAAKQYYQANDEALQFIRQLVTEKEIDCELTDEDAYLYSETEDYDDKMAKEADAYKTLGINGHAVEDIPIDLKFRKGLVMKNQAQFNPTKYLSHLVREMEQLGGLIYENTVAVDVKEGERPTIVTKLNNTITCDQIISCSHFPFYDGKGLFFSRMYAERSYIIAIKPAKKFEGGMYLSVEDPKRSIRSAMINGEEMLLIGGDKHKTGQGKETVQHFQALEIFAKENFGIDAYPYRWGAQDLITLDKLPYIGRITAKKSNIFIATGYRKWGMTNGTAAALLLKDLVMKKDNPYEDLFSPTRFYADPSIKTFISQNANVAAEFIKGKLKPHPRSADELHNDEGALVKYNNKRAGAYKDKNGELHVVDPTCTHLGCEVEWNNGERTWDCPCHGSRFSFDGEVYEGPADQPLKKLK